MRIQPSSFTEPFISETHYETTNGIAHDNLHWKIDDHDFNFGNMLCYQSMELDISHFIHWMADWSKKTIAIELVRMHPDLMLVFLGEKQVNAICKAFDEVIR